MQIVILAIIAMVLAGCTPKFEVIKTDTRFSEDKNPIYLSKNNRISNKSVAGGIHIDQGGVHIDPYIEKNPATGQILLLGFFITNTMTIHLHLAG